MITYKHEEYIDKAIEGVLFQEVNYKIELIICDDASPDKTQEIVNKYQTISHPLIDIKYYKHEKNIGIIQNFYWALKKCNGKFIAICEGDDFWIDKQKINNQINFLEKNLEYVAVTHNCMVEYKNNILRNRPFNLKIEKCDINFNDLLGHRPFHTCSIVFNSIVLNNFDWNEDIFSADRYLFLFLSQFGKIMYCPKIMGIYRKHSGGISNSVNALYLQKDFNMVNGLNEITKLERNKLYQYIHGSLFYNTHTISILNLMKHSCLYLFYYIKINGFHFRFVFDFLLFRLTRKVSYILISKFKF